MSDFRPTWASGEPPKPPVAPASSAATVTSRADGPNDSFDAGHQTDSSGSAPQRRRRMSRASVARMKRARTRRRIVLAVLGVLALAIVALTGWFAASAWTAKGEVEAAVNSAKSLQAQVQDGDIDLDKIADGIDEVSLHIDRTYAQTSQPVWALAEFTPHYGSDIRTVREVVRILEDVSNNAMPALANVARTVDLDDIGIKDGVISLGGLDDVAPDLARANQSLTDAVAQLNTVGETHFPQLNSAITQGREQLGTLADLTGTAGNLASILPSMLATGESGGTRTYLVLAQNNAELRATGGIASSWGVLTISAGRLALGSFATPPSDAVFSDAEARSVLTADERNLFSTKMATDYQDINFTPDFTRTAKLAHDIWKRAGNGGVDGVISVDPVFLQRLLAVAGPVTLDDTASALLSGGAGDSGTGSGGSDVTLNGQNAAQILLNRIYLGSSTQSEQDMFFALAASQVFDHVLHNLDGKGMQMLKTVRQAVQDGHLYLWSAHEAEQEQLAGVQVSGALSSKPAQPEIGVYFNDATMGKMDWYLKREVTSKYDKTYPNGARQYTLTVTLTNTADASAVAAAPDLLRGYDDDGKPRHGEIETVLYVYAPAGGRLVDWSEDFDQIATHDGLTVGAKTVTLEPGERFTTTIHVLASASAGNTEPTIRQTPSTD
ncbi:DUF4012 domain-containing protein [Bifidobacterium miconisargentati]|uniref:DUF4012 domain-containing protein n=1 Tax=Bifidobacterium miconisargentati TaxID=2834437 RepID=UPI001F2543BB|nr:DUF4012 domain-containing protein [Bifidobacterium miconisargentati]